MRFLTGFYPFPFWGQIVGLLRDLSVEVSDVDKFLGFFSITLI